MDRQEAGAYAALVAVQVFFGTMAVAGKIALRDLPPLALASVRVCVGALALLLVARLLHGPLRPTRGELRTFATLGFFGVTVNQVLFMVGLTMTSAVNAVLLIATIPAFAYLFSVLKGDQQADGWHLAGLAVAFVGVGVVVGAGSFTPGEVLGDALVVVNAASYAWYLVLSRRVLREHAPAVVVAWSFVAGAALTVTIGLRDVVALDWIAVPARAWGAVAFIVIFPTIGSYLLNLVALRRLPARTVAAFVYLQPVVGAALAVLVLGEPLGGGTAVGAGLVLAGIALVAREKR